MIRRGPRISVTTISGDRGGPLPPHSKYLRHQRYEAWVGRKIESGRYAEIADGRFASLADADTWVKKNYPNAEVVRFTFFGESDGWQPHAIRTDSL